MKRYSFLLLFCLAFNTFKDVSSAVARPSKPPRNHTRLEPKTTTPIPELMTTEAPDEREWESSEAVKVSMDEKERAARFFDNFDLDNVVDEPDPNLIINLLEVIDFKAETPMDEASMKQEGMFKDSADTRFIKNPDFDKRVSEIQQYRFIYDDEKNHYRLTAGPYEESSRLRITYEFKNYEMISVKIKVDTDGGMEIVNDINMIRDLQWKQSIKDKKNTNLPVWGESMFRSSGVLIYQEQNVVMTKSCFEVFFTKKDTGFAICFSSLGNPVDVKTVEISQLSRILSVKKGRSVEGKLETSNYFNPGGSEEWIPHNLELPYV